MLFTVMLVDGGIVWCQGFGSQKQFLGFSQAVLNKVKRCFGQYRAETNQENQNSCVEESVCLAILVRSLP